MELIAKKLFLPLLLKDVSPLISWDKMWHLEYKVAHN